MKLPNGHLDKWFVGASGEGFDGSQLVLPCEGHLSEVEAEVIDFELVSLYTKLDQLERRVKFLEARFRKV